MGEEGRATVADGECESCGRPDEDLVEVHRVYLVPEPVTVEGTERWCVSCRSQYPHELAG